MRFVGNMKSRTVALEVCVCMVGVFACTRVSFAVSRGEHDHTRGSGGWRSVFVHTPLLSFVPVVDQPLAEQCHVENRRRKREQGTAVDAMCESR